MSINSFGFQRVFIGQLNTSEKSTALFKRRKKLQSFLLTTIADPVLENISGIFQYLTLSHCKVQTDANKLRDIK
jgi:hypothetical protein